MLQVLKVSFGVVMIVVWICFVGASHQVLVGRWIFITEGAICTLALSCSSGWVMGPTHAKMCFSWQSKPAK